MFAVLWAQLDNANNALKVLKGAAQTAWCALWEVSSITIVINTRLEHLQHLPERVKSFKDTTRMACDALWKGLPTKDSLETIIDHL